MQDIVIIGTGGCAREVLWLLEQNNTKNKIWNIKGFISNDNIGEIIDGYKVLGNDEWFLQNHESVNVVIAVGDPTLRKKLAKKYTNNYNNLKFPSIISKDVRHSNRIKYGAGCIIFAGTTLTTNITMGDFVSVNINCSISHDCVIEDYVTISPSAHIAGNVNIGQETMIGMGANIIQGIMIGKNVTIGAGSVIIRNINDNEKIVGVPGRSI